MSFVLNFSWTRGKKGTRTGTVTEHSARSQALLPTRKRKRFLTSRTTVATARYTTSLHLLRRRNKRCGGLPSGFNLPAGLEFHPPPLQPTVRTLRRSHTLTDSPRTFPAYAPVELTRSRSSTDVTNNNNNNSNRYDRDRVRVDEFRLGDTGDR
ncbi:hypothetical protein ZHAS_00011766 [Anopheles sinensis]|uniref:Uncharacterized protein n=1 Tax=Anopheles sinensis TaxID=74873 RepID=A0A084W102_ANOSI|nr:hypothetical protein ZHAS_00011766 [Anopheles sinensis]